MWKIQAYGWSLIQSEEKGEKNRDSEECEITSRTLTNATGKKGKKENKKKKKIEEMAVKSLNMTKNMNLHIQNTRLQAE